MAKSYNFAVVGYGLSAKVFHIPHLTAIPSFRLYGVVQRRPSPTDSAAADHPGIATWTTTDAMLADPAVDVVVVTTLPDNHFELTQAALNAGKHVIVEKPFVPTHAEAVALGRLAAEKGRVLTVYQNRRWDSDFLTLRKLLQEEKLGRITEFETHFDRYSPTLSRAWQNEARPGNGAIYDFGTHLMDQVVTLFGLPQRITGFVVNQRSEAPRGTHAEPSDSFTVHLHYKDGLMATAKAAAISPVEEQLRFWVRGEQGSFKKYHLDIQEAQLRAGKMPGQEGFGVEPESHHGTLTLVKEGKMVRETVPTLPPKTYVEYYRVLEKALNGEGDVPVKAEEAAAVIRLVELAKESSKLGKTLDV